jgi:positive regulator of sigma E activity
MIMHPAIIALFVGSLLVSCMVLYSVRYGITILTYWNLQSGNELQLELEKKTYLISTIMAYAFAFQLFSLFLFIFTADKLHILFTGAMCAAGTLNVNGFGYPALSLKIINFILGGTWLVMNYADNKAFDYPLIRRKYLLLIVIAPFVIAETVVQGAYFLNLKPHVITSCCGSLFSPEGDGLQGGMASLPSMPMRIVFYLTMGLTLLTGFYFYLQEGWIGSLFALASVLTFAVSVASLISFISLYFYELPTHRCPFCILQREYHYIGYPLYITLLAGVVGGTGVGALMPFRGVESLKQVVPLIQKRLAIMSIASYLLFTIIVTSAMVFTDFKLEGY